MRILGLLGLAFVVGCSSGSSNPQPDMTAAPKDMAMAIFSCCGLPGDTGNQFGVGQYCDDNTPCTGTKAIFCASLGGDPNQHFCTFPCQAAADGGTDPCGDNATCQCSGGQCGCYPNVCAMRGTPDGCM